MERKIYPSASQKRRLYAIIEADEELRIGKFSSTFTKRDAERRWQNIADEINAVGGAVKNGKEWKKTWQDMKSKSKKKQSAINRAASATGGGPPPPPLTEEESIVLRTISKDSISGHADSKESVVEFIDLIPSTYQGPTTSMASDVASSSQDMKDNILAPPEHFQDRPPIIQEPQNEATPALQKGKKKTAAKRLQESLEVAKSLERTLKEKNDFKIFFYQKYIEEMQKQSNALMMIANNLKH